MSSFLVQHAIKNVWCTPDQDRQFIFKPARLTHPTGVFNNFELDWKYYTLPTQGERYHLYQIGQLHPSLMGIFDQEGVWISIPTLASYEKLFFDAYLINGIHIPSTHCYVLLTVDRNLIVAVRDHVKIPSLKTETAYFRVYSNAYFDSVRSDHITDEIKIKGLTIKTDADIVLFQNEVTNLRARGYGWCLTFINGYLTDAATAVNVKKGDYVEYVFDSSIRQWFDLPVKDLKVFTSELDQCQKYIIHYPTKFNSIQYIDDCDFYLVNKDVTGSQGSYIHKNDISTARNITHQDHSLKVSTLDGLTPIAGKGSLDKYYVRVYIRNSGYERALVNEHSRIKELYKLSHADILGAMQGINALIEEWRASNLEKSLYTDIMQRNGVDITNEDVERAYGYNAVSKLIGDTPYKAQLLNGRNQTPLFNSHFDISTAFEYDIDGKLIGWYSHTGGSVYYTRNNTAASVEMLVGEGGREFDTYFGNNTLTWVKNPNYNYRYYRTPIVAGIPDLTKWEDITDRTDLYYIQPDGKVKWEFNTQQWYPQIKSDGRLVVYDLILIPVQGLIKFSLQVRERHGLILATRLAHTQPNRIELFLNNNILIEGLDYFINFPEIVITNKEYLINDNYQKITVRMMGFCESNMQREAYAEHGFVKHGLLSRNNRFDIRDDKVMRFVVDGKLKHRDALKFSEDHSGVQVNSIKNGRPYVIRDIIVPIRSVTNNDTYVERKRSQVMDKKISDYLTLKLPEPEINLPNIIENPYQLQSPLCARLIDDLKTGQFNNTPIRSFYNNSKLHELMTPYLYLLKFEPTLNGVDPEYVKVHPHAKWTVVSLDIYQYTFLDRVVKEYLNDKVDLSYFIKVEKT